MLAIEKNRKSPNTKSDMWYTNRARKPGKTAHIEIKGNEEADKAAKRAIDMPGMPK